MRAVITRVKSASVSIAGSVVGEIGHGLLIRCGQHSFGEGAQLVPPRQLGHDACPHKAARAGDQ